MPIAVPTVYCTAEHPATEDWMIRNVRAYLNVAALHAGGAFRVIVKHPLGELRGRVETCSRCHLVIAISMLVAVTVPPLTPEEAANQ